MNEKTNNSISVMANTTNLMNLSINDSVEELDKHNNTISDNGVSLPVMKSSKTQRKFYDRERLAKLSVPRELPKIVSTPSKFDSEYIIININRKSGEEGNGG